MKRILFLGLLSLFFQWECLANVLTFGSYNVENLFDAKHDKENGLDKEDWSFLPREASGKKEACQKLKSRHHRRECLATDWSDSVVELKVGQIKEILSKGRVLPDFLGLQEIENPQVLARLAEKLGYTELEITKSLDARGIDVALLYNNKNKNKKVIKKIARLEHVVPVDYATRNILEVEFLINNQYPLTVFVNHWPSLANPDSWRIKAAEVLYSRSQEIMKKNPRMNIVALGDFNTIESCDPHPFQSVLYRNQFFSDVEKVSLKIKGRSNDFLGTYYYLPKDQWSSLDHFFVNKNLLDQKELDLNVLSFEIYAPQFAKIEIKRKDFQDFQKNVKLIYAPARFNPKGKTKKEFGYSDHFPIFMELRYPGPLDVKKKSNH